MGPGALQDLTSATGSSTDSLRNRYELFFFGGNEDERYDSEWSRST